MLALVFFVLLLHPALSTSEESDAFDYSDGPKGPSNWGSIKPEWKICNAGRSQSPIGIKFEDLRPFCDPKLLQIRYRATNATLSSLDHDIALSFEENAGTLTLDGVRYKLSEYHIHSPSEHTIKGIRYAAEGHLVHRSSDGRIAVVSVLYSIGSESEADVFIEEVEHLLPALGSGSEMHAGFVDPSKLNVAGKSFYRYVGSLTTPPCTEGVIWNILRQPRKLSRRQFQLLKDTLGGDSARPLQASDGRVVSYRTSC